MWIEARGNFLLEISLGFSARRSLASVCVCGYVLAFSIRMDFSFSAGCCKFSARCSAHARKYRQCKVLMEKATTKKTRRATRHGNNKNAKRFSFFRALAMINDCQLCHSHWVGAWLKISSSNYHESEWEADEAATKQARKSSIKVISHFVLREHRNSKQV